MDLERRILRGMVFDERKNEYVLSTGRRAYAHNGIIGLDHEGGVFEGYDGGFELYDGGFTDAERAEIADLMIARWTAWKEGRADANVTVVNTYAEQPVGRANPNMAAMVADAWEKMVTEKINEK